LDWFRWQVLACALHLGQANRQDQGSTRARALAPG
jgi:hypothetical protein